MVNICLSNADVKKSLGLVLSSMVTVLYFFGRMIPAVRSLISILRG